MADFLGLEADNLHTSYSYVHILIEAFIRTLFLEVLNLNAKFTKNYSCSSLGGGGVTQSCAYGIGGRDIAFVIFACRFRAQNRIVKLYRHFYRKSSEANRTIPA